MIGSKELHHEAKAALKGGAFSRLTIQYLLILYAATAAVELATMLFEDRLIIIRELHIEFFIWSGALSLLLRLFKSAWEVGHQSGALRTGRKQTLSFPVLADGLRQFERFTALLLLKVFFIAVWTMLLIVPGVIAFYRYRMAEKLMLDDPTLSPLDALRKSAELMDGRKKALLYLDLSFWKHYLIIFILEFGVRVAEFLGYPLEGLTLQIGTFCLSTVLLILAEWHELPTVQTAYACFYDHARACKMQADLL